MPESAPTAASQTVYAGFWRRGAAYFVDSLVLLIPSVAIGAAMGHSDVWAAVLQLGVWWLYKAGMESSARQATLGKRALGIKVTGLDGERISFARATGRYFGTILSSVILGIGFLMAAFTQRRQALHDIIASCLVVRTSATPEEIRDGAGTMPMTAGVWVAVVFFLLLPLSGILAAIAIPAYQDSVVRAKVREAIVEGTRWQSRAATEIAAYRPDAAASPDEGKVELDASSRYVSRIVIRKPERALYVLLDRANLGASWIQPGAAIRFTMDRDGTTWTCRASGVPDRYLPPSCRP